jgi:hypothetical protein
MVVAQEGFQAQSGRPARGVVVGVADDDLAVVGVARIFQPKVRAPRAGAPGGEGHSLGGLHVRSFAAQFPDDVAGTGLLDSTAAKPGPAPPPQTGSDDAFGRVAALLPAVPTSESGA